MFTLQLLSPLPFADSCWTTNTLTEECQEEDCDREFWKKQARRDLGVSEKYFNLDSGLRERYVQISSRWYAVPGSEIFIDQGLAQLFSARDRDKCMLTYLSTFPNINWSNGLIGAALSGDYSLFSAFISLKYPSVEQLGVSSIFSGPPSFFAPRLQRAAALGGNEEIFDFVLQEDFDDIQAVTYGGNINILEKILRKKDLNEEEREEALDAAFAGGREDMVRYLQRDFRGNMDIFTEAAATSRNPSLLSITGTEDKQALVRGYARSGNIEGLKDFQGDWTIILDAAVKSIYPQRYEIASLALEKGAQVTKIILSNATLTGDKDLLLLLLGDKTPPLSLLYDAASTGNLELVKLFPSVTDLKLANYAAQLGFGELNIHFTRK